MNNSNYQNSVNSYTRIATTNIDSHSPKTTSTLIDVVIHNMANDTDVSSECFPCFFSDHHFVLTSINISPKSIKSSDISENQGRQLTEPIIATINEKLNTINFSDICSNSDTDVDTIWTSLKNKTLKIMNDVAPIKIIKIKRVDQFPWRDKELSTVKMLRDFYYYESKKSSEFSVKFTELYKEYRTKFQSLNRSKMTDYFKNKGTKDFKNSKKFWKFYSASIKLKSDLSDCSLPSNFVQNNEVFDEPKKNRQSFQCSFYFFKIKLFFNSK
jgi:hypothetical protein